MKRKQQQQKNEEKRRSRYGGFGSESAHDPVRPQLEQMAHPADLGIRAQLDSLLAVPQRLAVEENVAQVQHCVTKIRNMIRRSISSLTNVFLFLLTRRQNAEDGVLLFRAEAENLHGRQKGLEVLAVMLGRALTMSSLFLLSFLLFASVV